MITKEQREAIEEVLKDLDAIINFPLQGEKTIAQVAFYNGSFVHDYNKNRKIIEDMLKEND